MERSVVETISIHVCAEALATRELAPRHAGKVRRKLRFLRPLQERAWAPNTHIGPVPPIRCEGLVAFGAPQELLRAAEQAQEDERRHTRQMGDLARRFGTEPARPVIAEASPRGLFDFALENAIEGCVRETMGAVQARYQSVRAQDPEVRATLREIADDETRHAELSWAVHAWVRSQLSEDEREALSQAQQDAIATLRREAHHEQPAAVRQCAGSPDTTTALAMVDALEAQLWGKPAALA